MDAEKEIIQSIKISAEKFKEITKKKFRIILDYSEESLEVADDLITIFFKEHKSHHYQAVVLIGSYLGEVVINNLGGSWQKDFSIINVGETKTTVNPMNRAKKRLSIGLGDSLVNYYRNLKLNCNYDINFAINQKIISMARDKLKKDKWDQILYERMTNENEPRYAREEAADILGKIADRSYLPKLIKNIDDPVNGYYSIIVLQRLPDQTAYKPLLNLLSRTKSPIIKMQAALALGEIKNTGAVDKLIELINDENEIICHFASLALGKIGGDETTSKLLEVVGGLREGNRIYAISALEGIGDKNATPALIEALFSKDEEVKEAAARAFQFIPDDRAFKPLLYTLQHSSKRLKILSAYSLAHIDPPKSMPYLKELLKDDTELVRSHIATLLKFLEKKGEPVVKCV